MGCSMHIDALRSLPLFGHLYEAAIAGIRSDTVECLPDRKAAEEIARILAEEMPGFSYPESEFENSLALLQMIRSVIDSADQSRFGVQREASDPDNIGSYAFGSRYWLTIPGQNVRLYAYFGVIFSHQKDPAGLFAEIDQPSNPAFYDAAYNAVPESPDYVISRAEPKFLKLFFPESHVQDFNSLSEKGQMQLMQKFLNSTNYAFTAPWI